MNKRSRSQNGKKTPWPLIAFLAVMVVAVGFSIYLGARGKAGNPVLRTQDDVPRISPQEAYQAVQNGDAVLLDTRSAEQFAASHAAGALSLPVADVEAALATLDPEVWYITYCT
ncbi:MAG TPA: hypothetical protein PKK90_04640 [Anaerolineaceae bacterium]|nr:hypothetical protein [Anaerolineaceae bacterium]HPT23176.1 hypothetical protein [Anaerolineaceae bacterium]